MPSAPQVPYGLRPLRGMAAFWFPASIVSLMNWTDPSTITACTPPAWWLVAVKIPPGEPSKIGFLQLGPLGGKMVLKPVWEVDPSAHRLPRCHSRFWSVITRTPGL